AQQQLANEKLKLDLRPLVLKLRLSCSYRVASLAIHLIETRPSIYPIKDQPPFLTSATCEHQPGNLKVLAPVMLFKLRVGWLKVHSFFKAIPLALHSG
ncbi:hypothetical protein H105_02984, partial [Trichophyton soudanense CBS 452.61]